MCSKSLLFSCSKMGMIGKEGELVQKHHSMGTVDLVIRRKKYGLSE